MKDSSRVKIFLALIMAVFCSNGCGKDRDNNNSSAYYPPPTEIIVEPVPVEQGTQIDLTWETPEGAIAEIIIERRDLEEANANALVYRNALENGSPNDWTAIANLPSSATTYSDQSVGCGKRVEYRVCNLFYDGHWGCSLPIQATTPICPPRNLIASILSTDLIELTWTDNSYDETGFNIYRKTAPSGTWEIIGSVTADITTYQDPYVLCSTRYMYKVRAFDEQGESGSSNEADVSTEICSPGPGCKVILVDDDAVGLGTGSTWEDAFLHPQDAVNAANSCDQIWVAEGTYISGTTDPVLTMKDGVEIYGGFAGTELTLDERGDPSVLPSILDGEDVSWHVVVGASNSRLDGFTITRGNAFGIGNEENGGGMSNINVANITITNCIFDTNHAKYHAGAIRNVDSSVIITDCIFRNNTAINPVFNNAYGGAIHNTRTFHIIGDSLFDNNYADATGGAIYNWDNSNGEITNCTFTNNTGMYSSAGAIRNYDSSPLIKNCFFSGNYGDSSGAIGNFNFTSSIENSTFDDNHAKYQGGAILNLDSSVTISDCVFRNNTVINSVFSYAYGGAVHNTRTFHIIKDSLFDNNYADATGGAIYNWDNSNGEIINCTFTNNTGMYPSAGAIRNYDSSPLIKDCIFSGNYGDSSGAVGNWNSTSSIENSLFYNNTSNLNGGAIEIQGYGMSKIINCTIVNNDGGSKGGGIYVRWDGIAEVSNTILWGNTATNGSQIQVDTGTLSVTNSDVAGGWPGTGNIDVNPLFSDSIFHLDQNSSCIDTGTATDAPTGDLDGNPRPSGSGFDMGAYEYQQ